MRELLFDAFSSHSPHLQGLILSPPVIAFRTFQVDCSAFGSYRPFLHCSMNRGGICNDCMNYELYKSNDHKNHGISTTCFRDSQLLLSFQELTLMFTNLFVLPDRQEDVLCASITLLCAHFPAIRVQTLVSSDYASICIRMKHMWDCLCTQALGRTRAQQIRPVQYMQKLDTVLAPIPLFQHRLFSQVQQAITPRSPRLSLQFQSSKFHFSHHVALA